MLCPRCLVLCLLIPVLWLVPAASSQTKQPTCKTAPLDPVEQKRIKDALAENDARLSIVKSRIQKGTDIIDKWKLFSTEATTFADQVGEYIQRCRDVDKNLEDARAKGHEKIRVPWLLEIRDKCRNDERQLTNKLLWYQKEMQLIGSQIGEIENHLSDLKGESEGLSKEKRIRELERSVDSLVNELGNSLERFDPNSSCALATQ